MAKIVVTTYDMQKVKKSGDGREPTFGGSQPMQPNIVYDGFITDQAMPRESDTGAKGSGFRG